MATFWCAFKGYSTFSVNAAYKKIKITLCQVCLPAVYSKTCVRQPPLKLTLVVDVEKWLSYKGSCHVILLAKLHDMYLYKTDNFFHINHYLKLVSKVALLHRFYCNESLECSCS